MKPVLLEILSNDGRSIRAAYNYGNLLLVVKVFDVYGDDHFSVKYYHIPEDYEVVKSFWRTQTDITNTWKGCMYDKIARAYLSFILSKIGDYSDKL